MKLDLGSFAFGSYVTTGGNTPSWGTSLGQKKPDLKLTYPGYDNIVIGMMYKSIPVDKVYIPLGKGGHVCNSLEDEGIQLAAMFDKVYINEVRVNAPFIMLIYQDGSENWAGRRTLKYNPKIEYRRGEDDIISNVDFVGAAKDALQLADESCWVVSDIYIINQDELHLIVGIVNSQGEETYPSAELRKAAFIEAIQTTYDENPGFAKKYSVDNLNNSDELISVLDEPLQQIYYGAPGTGKSYAVDDVCKKYRHHRTTFHPDSDYSTFVGCYKPTKNSHKQLVGKNELVNKCKEYSARAGYNNQNLTQFGYDYAMSLEKWIKNDPTFNYTSLLTDAGVTDTSASSYITAGMELAKNIAPKVAPITYEFVPQTFTKAYIEAWENPTEPVFLVIEEINRGNCAQIFGDLFQLLDRDDETDMSSYEISPDADLQNYIAEQGLDVSDVLDSNKEDISAKIMSGELMKLPSNLYIWATMNTSDQSLFPIDSAFKRRWDWKYVPINTSKEDGRYINANGTKYSWSSFLENVNEEIANTTSSEDKQLGFYFCKAKGKEISADKFVSKVLFYLYNDVFKDYDFEAAFFKHSIGENKDKIINFREFFNVKENKIEEKVVAELLDNLKVNLLESSEEDDDNADEANGLSVSIDGQNIHEKNDLETYVKALQTIGMDKIAPLNIQCHNQMIVGIEPPGNYAWRTIDGYKVLTFKLHKHMERILKEIAQGLGIDIQVSWD